MMYSIVEFSDYVVITYSSLPRCEFGNLDLPRPHYRRKVAERLLLRQFICTLRWTF